MCKVAAKRFPSRANAAGHFPCPAADRRAQARLAPRLTNLTRPDFEWSMVAKPLGGQYLTFSLSIRISPSRQGDQ